MSQSLQTHNCNPKKLVDYIGYIEQRCDPVGILLHMDLKFLYQDSFQQVINHPLLKAALLYRFLDIGNGKLQIRIKILNDQRIWPEMKVIAS